MTQYYTGKGDKGLSSIIGGVKLSKDDVLFDLLGDLDELNSYLAVSLQYINDREIKKDIDTIQDQLFSISAIVASTYIRKILKTKVPSPDVLEEGISRLGKELPELRKFVIPGGSEASSHLHVARSVARRTERRLVSLHKRLRLTDDTIKYMNRLSSYLFVAALYMNHVNKIKEKNPRYS